MTWWPGRRSPTAPGARLNGISSTTWCCGSTCPVPFEQLVVSQRDRSRSAYSRSCSPTTRPPDGPGAGSAPIGHHAPARTLDATPPVKFDLVLALGEAGRADGGLAGRIDYRTSLFDPGTMQRLAGHLVTLLTAAAADPGQRIGELPVLTAAERARVLAEWNDTSAPVPAVTGMGELFTRQAAATPDAIALVAGNASVSYAALTARAARLARYLAARGAGPESVIALCLGREADLVVAVLAVWLAGAAYVPLDPDYPADRLAFMLADSGAALLIAHRSQASDMAAGAPGWTRSGSTTPACGPNCGRCPPSRRQWRPTRPRSPT